MGAGVVGNRILRTNDFAGKTISLTGDIDISGWLATNSPTKGWKPIGGPIRRVNEDEPILDNPFNGTLDGDGHTISGLWVNRLTSGIGFFGYTGSSAEISNLMVEIDNSSSTKRVQGNKYVGGLAGLNKGTITDCTVWPLETEELMVGGSSYSGGLTGSNGGTIINCYAAGEVNCYIESGIIEGANVGGLIGLNTTGGTITNSFYRKEADLNDALNDIGEGLDENPNNDIPGITTLTTILMITATPFTDAGWDFNTIWAIDTSTDAPLNSGYPYLHRSDPEPDPDPDPNPIILYRTLTLTTGTGIVIDKTKNTFQIQSGNPFSFVITLAEGYEGLTPTVTVNGRAKGLIPVGTGKWSCIISEIFEDTEVSVSFSPTGNEMPDAPTVYTRSGQLFIDTPLSIPLRIYTVTGQMVVSRSLTPGLTTIPLPAGIYIVRTDKETRKVVVR